jgi:HEAT repeat protein
MAATCPTCQRPIDPVRAPVVRVHGARVVAYCSTGCADAASGIARADAPAPAPRAADVRTPDVARPEPPAAGVAVRADAPSATDHRRRRRNQVVALCGATIAGGMAIAIVEAVSPSTPTRVDAAIATAARPAAPPPAPVITADSLEERAVAALRARLTSPSPRIQRIAATALARTRDPAALAALGEALTEETSEIARLDIAYALGRGGDPRGVAALGRAVTASSRRDVKADAARLLLQLGDPGGVAALKQIGGMAQHKLAVAEILAAAGDAEGLATLAAIRADSSSTPDERLRAAVALGRAGVGAVGEKDAPALRAELRAALDDGRYNVGAAAALARLGDDSAWPALEAQLAVPSLRVGAAIQLRRLRPDLDAVPLLPALAAALDGEADVAAVSAAEALLILLGPAELAARD